MYSVRVYKRGQMGYDFVYDLKFKSHRVISVSSTSFGAFTVTYVDGEQVFHKKFTSDFFYIYIK